ncbi:ATP-dependent RNA helicase [Aquipluma nitroreducens]|uniref:ATP-dependent RNA helicase n=1 Tax=Aquipluma nitroreducens TaxID=2010828 RepID=A0A5K7SG49_9BACT|nr:DEAD/DEAH box helicase [Aquipluma nitroreducens]BBE20465.1 ATP-dependent RNA helicase [Aquipluma nitroreducens]
MRFDELGLNDKILEAISYMGYEKASEIQELTVPAILEGKDILACAQTGTGKTAAFMLPILNHISIEENHDLSTLIIVPTRELAIQINQQIQGFSYFLNINSVTVYGGRDGSDWDAESKALTKGTNIVVATPGKLISHLNLGYVKFDKIKHLVLDEADRMLDIGFYDDLMRILSYVPEARQTLMFSATMPQKIRELASKILKDPVEFSTAISKPAEGVLQAAYVVHENQKIPVINSLISDKPDLDSILVFSSTKRKVTEIVRSLKKTGIAAEGISSDLEQKEREDVLMRFRSRRTRVLVATDVLSRGIDIKDINLIINFDVPGSAEDYVHRVGRTARADKTGIAISLINEHDMDKFDKIEKLIEMEVLKIPVPSELGEGPVYKVRPPRKGGGRPQSKRKFSTGGKPNRGGANPT